MEIRPSHHEPLLEARRIKRRSRNDDTWLLRETSLCLQPADRVVLTGPSGGGKTVLLRALASLDPLESGQLLWRGAPLLGSGVPEFRCQVIYLHQKPVLLEGSVEHNLRLPYSLQMHREAAYDHSLMVKQLSQMARGADFLDLPVRTLSGGESQLVAVLRAVQLKPVVLLLDEPTAALDENGTRAIEQLILDWYEKIPGQRAFIWVSHDRQQAKRVATRFWHVDQGEITERSSLS